jgi:serine phosphatase RsbU (regulator of sigma subunit)
LATLPATIAAPTTSGIGASAFDVGTMLKAAQAFSAELVLDKLLERVLRHMLENAGAQRVAFVLFRAGQLRVEGTMTVDPDVVRVGLGTPIEEATDLPHTVIRHVASTQQALVVGNAARDEALRAVPHIVQNRVRSVACVPMVHQGRLLGVLYLENNLAQDAFTPARNELLQALASHAAIAVDNALLYTDVRDATEKLRRANETLEIEVAARTEQLSKAMAELWSEMDIALKIQTALLPEDPVVTGYELAAVMKPAAHVGGDYYDVFRANGQEWVLIGDVSGHGVPAGLVMMMVQTAVRAIVSALSARDERLTPSRVLAKVNETLRSNLEKLGKGQYMTISAFCFEDGVIHYSGLHEDIHVYRAATGRVERIQTRGLWLGILDDIENLLSDDTLVVEPGDMVLLTTDGVTEARRDNRMLGPEGLSELFQRACAKGDNTATVLSELLRSLESFTKGDDVTMLVLRRQSTMRDGDG